MKRPAPTNPAPPVPASRLAAEGASHRRYRIALWVALVLVLVAYSDSLHNSFHFDDSHVIVTNLYIRSLGNIPRFFVDAYTFSSLPANATYRPIVSLTLAIDYWVGHGLNPVPFHCSQILYLVVLGALLVVFFRHLLETAGWGSVARWAALAAAALYCLHPVNTEPMNSISARSDILSTLGIAAAFVVAIRFPRQRRYGYYLIPMALGCLAKAPAAAFAPLYLVYLLFFERDLAPSRWLSASERHKFFSAIWESIPAFVTAFVFGILDIVLSPHWKPGGADKITYLRTQFFILLHYVRLFFVPFGLTADTDLTTIPHWYDTRVVAGLALVAVMLWILWRFSARRENRPVAFGLVWFFVGLLPSSSFFPLAEVANEHRTFLPYIGMSLSVCAGAVLVARRRPSEGSSRRWLRREAKLLVIVLLAFAVGTWLRNRVWTNEETLWKDVTEKSPENGRGLMNYGLTQMAKGQLSVAKDYFERAKVLLPYYPTLQINLGVVNSALGNQPLAEEHFRQAMQLSPDANSCFYYARWLAEQGRSLEAIPLLQQAIRLSPADANPRTLLMQLWAAEGDQADLRNLASETLTIIPSDPTIRAYASGEIPYHPASVDFQGWFALGNTLISHGDYSGAIQVLRQALRDKPDSADALNNYGWSLGKLGFLQQGEAALEKAVALNPVPALYRNNLAWIKSRLAAPPAPASTNLPS